ncbi:Uma2 family endonuclease [Actinomadura scrupuli]|uniref:Uma2 family endonuclease n=1 Tax=Actinomadura scrupuli TaxID=559629 RepID=UPI003D980683
MSITTEARLGVQLPDTPYALWARGELDDHLHLPDRYFTVEIIDGEIVASPAPALGHGAIVHDLAKVLVQARLVEPAFSWKCLQRTGLNLVGIRDGYVPDLMVLDTEIFARARQTQLSCLVPGQVELVVEVTSPSNAAHDRQPAGDHPRTTKWTGYARVGIPYYLLVDREPKIARTTLFTGPDQSTGAYLRRESWGFGETVRLPDPFRLEIPTAGWRAWD